MAAVAAFETLTGPRGPDSGVADSMVVAAFAVGVPVFALAVLAVAALALWVNPGPDPPERAGEPPG